MKNKLFLTCLFTLLNSYCFSQCVDVDPTFGNNGFVTNAPGVSPNPIPAFSDYIMQNDKIIAFTTSGAVRRFNNNGSLDTSFGVNGIYNCPSGYYLNKVVPIGSNFYLVGYNYSIPNTYENFPIIKLDTNGNLLNNFGPFDFGENEEAIDLVQTSDNKLMVMVLKFNNIDSSGYLKLLMVKLNLDGTKDTTFQNNGSKEMFVFPQRTIPYKMVNYSGNKLLIVCTGNVGSNFEIGLVKMDENGNLDTTFNSTGTAFLDNGSQERVNEIQMKDNMLYARLQDGTNVNHRIVIYNLDTLNVIRTMTFNYYVGYYGSKFAVYDDNSMMVTGITDTCNPCNKNSVLHKYLPDGTVDTSFCSGGTQEYNISSANNYYVDDQASYIYRMGTDQLFIAGAYSIPYTGPQYASWLRLIPGTLATNNSEENKLILSPNPANDNLTLQLKNSIGGNATLQIFNSLGQLIKQDVVDMTANSVTIPVADLATDFYLIKIQDAEGNYYNSKFLKK